MAELTATSVLTWPTRPWMATAPHTGPGSAARYNHAPSTYAATPTVRFPFCGKRVIITTVRADLPRCPACIRRLTRHGLWPI